MDSGAAPGLRRKQEGRLLAGVCGGAGAYLGLDPAVVRLAFVLLTVAGGAGIVLYAALWLVLRPDIPNGSRGEIPASPAARVQLAAYGALWRIRTAFPSRWCAWMIIRCSAAGSGPSWARPSRSWVRRRMWTARSRLSRGRRPTSEAAAFQQAPAFALGHHAQADMTAV
ncbi:MAG: PspC domain-containing protein [Micromonosporaceae bacterium]